MKHKIIFLLAVIIFIGCKKSTAPSLKKDLRFKAQSGYGSLSISRNGVTLVYSEITGTFDTTLDAYPGDYEFLMTSVAPGYSWVEIYHNDTLVAKDARSHSNRINLKTNYRIN
jgi:hypothetical protein